MSSLRPHDMRHFAVLHKSDRGLMTCFSLTTDTALSVGAMHAPTTGICHFVSPVHEFLYLFVKIR